MRSISLYDPRTVQPRGVVEIDRENSLGKTITHCIPLNGINREIVTGAALTLGSGGAIRPSSTPRGGALSLRGSGSTTRASIPIDLSPYKKLSLSFWMYWDAFVNDDALAMEYGANYVANSGFLVDPNSGVPASGFLQVGIGSPAISFNGGYVTRPSAAAWHHYVILFNRTTGAAIGTSVYIDGALVSITGHPDNSDVADNFGNNSLYLMSRNNASLWGTGNLCNIVIRGGYLMSAQEALAEYLDPWQIFESPPIDIWVPSAGGGPTYTLSALTTSFALTGTSTSLEFNRALTAASGSFALSGTTAALKFNRVLSAGSGIFLLTGTDSTLTYSGAGGPTYTLSVTNGNFALTGTNVAFKRNRVIQLGNGSFSLSGTAATLTYSGAPPPSNAILYLDLLTGKVLLLKQL